MAALAGMLVARGFEVTGSDGPVYEPASSILKKLNIQVRSPFSPINLEPLPDLVVVGNVITASNPEARAVLERDIPYISMPEAIAHFLLKGRRVFMVTGTHGKTTSTAMIARVLDYAGRDPSLIVGGVARDFGANYRAGSGREFVIEGDEYDTAFFDKTPKFIHYDADGAIVTTVEFDHADIYRDLAHVKESFRKLADQMGNERLMVVSADSPDALDVSAAARRLTFGLSEGEFRADNIRIGADGARFSIVRRGKTLESCVYLPVGGRMNVANALGVYVLLTAFGIESSAIVRGLEIFSGVARRQEIVGEVAGVTVVDDFAHHPTAIRATLEAIAERFAGRRIVALFEPRSNTARRAVFQAPFAGAFDRAAQVYIAPTYFKENDPIAPAERLSTTLLAQEISARGPGAVACASNEELFERLLGAIQPRDVVVAMSNGAFDRIPQRLVEALRERRQFA
jgi:UDP-N-acetylmuramate: L-alanyl-gamma-D-glutamyl-meso-diaminopimelate ligase